MQSCKHSLSKHLTASAKNIASSQLVLLFSILLCSMIALTITMLSIIDLCFLPAVCISDILLCLVSFCFFLLFHTPQTQYLLKIIPSDFCLAPCGSCGSSLVSLEVFPQHKSCRQLLYVTLFFISPLFLCLFNLEFQNLLLSVPSVLSCVLFFSLFFPSYSVLLFFLIPVLFSPSVYSLYFLISLIVFFSNLFFLFKSVLFKSVLFFQIYFFCSCFCFLYRSSFW